jgi:hypothetical protein
MTLLDQEQNTQVVALGIILLLPIVFVVELFLKPSTYGKLHDSKCSYLGPLCGIMGQSRLIQSLAPTRGFMLRITLHWYSTKTTSLPCGTSTSPGCY